MTAQRRRYIGFVLFCCVMAACRPVDDTKPVITLERRPCFGLCPVYTLSIYRSGYVTYEGREYVSIRGRRDTTIHPDSVRALVQEAELIGYFGMLSEYHGRIINDTLIETITDQPSAISSVRIGNETKRIDNYYGGPESLHRFERHIDRVVNIVQWIGK